MTIEAVTTFTQYLIEMLGNDSDKQEINEQVILVSQALGGLDEQDRQTAMAAIHAELAGNEQAEKICAMLDIAQPKRDSDETTALLDNVTAELLENIEELEGVARDDALATLMGNLALMDGFQFERWRGALLKKKLVRAKTFDDEIKQRRAELQEQDEEDKPKKPVTWPYRIEHGRICYLYYRSGPDGTKLESQPVCDFRAVIKQEITDEDGSKTFVIEGKAVRGDGFKLEMDAEDFGSERLLKGKLDAASGAKDPVRAGMKKHLSAAIQLLTDDDMENLKRYRRTGWASNTFLIPGREPENVLIEPPEKLVYHIAQDAKLELGLECLENLILSLDAERTTVVIAFLFQAPLAYLAHWRNKRYVIFISGRSGSFKTSFAMVAMSLYGPEFNDESLLIKWGEGATRTSVMIHATHSHDLPLLIDNYKPSTGEGTRAFINLIHNIVEGGDRDRAKRSGTELQQTKKIYSWPLCTGEDIPDTDPASLARILNVPVRWQFGGDQPYLTKAQKLASHLCSIGGAWLDWLESDDGREKVKEMSAKFDEYRSKWADTLKGLRKDMVNPMRVATNLATNELTWEILCQHPEIGSLAQKYSDAHKRGLSDVVAVAMSEATAEALEARRFLSAIGELVTTKQVILAPKDQELMTESERTKLEYMPDRIIGWQDASTLYLLPDVTRKRVEMLLGKDALGGISNTSLYRQLDDLGTLQRKGPKSTTVGVRIAGKTQRVLCLRADAVSVTDFEEKSVTPDDEEGESGAEIGAKMPF
jgi:hypothetical protein